MNMYELYTVTGILNFAAQCCNSLKYAFILSNVLAICF